MSQIKVTDVLAAELKFDFDYEKIKEEMLSMKPFWIYTPPNKHNLDAALSGMVHLAESRDLYDKIDYFDSDGTLIKKEIKGQEIFYLRRHKDNPNNTTKFSYTKNLDTEGWDWIEDYRSKVPYTIKCIEGLPFKKIGCVRVFVSENTFFPTHRDSNIGKALEQSTDYDRCLGISIIPDTGNVPMNIYSFKNKKVHNIHGNAMLFNDSAPHGVPMTNGVRITIRVFGEIDFQDLVPFINSEQLYY